MCSAIRSSSTACTVRRVLRTNRRPGTLIRLNVLYTRLGKASDKGLKAIEDMRLEPREIRGIITELDQVIADTLETVADLRATERHLAGQS